MKRRIVALLMAFTCLFFCGCSKEEGENTKKPAQNQNTESKAEIKEEAANETEEAEIKEVEVIYAKTPSEAADKCLQAFKSGNLDEARHYVTPDGKAFNDLALFRSEMVKSFGVGNNEKLKAQAEKLVGNALKQFIYIQKDVKINGKTATVTYSVSMPDTASIDYSKYSDKYMMSLGLTQETLMLQLEGMSEQEMMDWSMEYSLGVMNYIFEQGGSFERIDKTTTVTVIKESGGWLVSNIKNS